VEERSEGGGGGGGGGGADTRGASGGIEGIVTETLRGRPSRRTIGLKRAKGTFPSYRGKLLLLGGTARVAGLTALGNFN